MEAGRKGEAARGSRSGLRIAKVMLVDSLICTLTYLDA